MDYFLTSILSYILLYKYIAIFVIVFLSGLILPLPTNSMLLAAGAFASQGYMDASGIFWAALVSNVLGDSLGWALTRFWGTRFITREHLGRFKAVAKTEEFVRTHARLTILVTRFLGTPGSIVNFLCGLAGIPYRTFVLYDIIGNALDTAFFVIAGYYLGTFSENFSDIAQLAGWIVLVLLLIFAVVRLFIRKNRHGTITA